MNVTPPIFAAANAHGASPALPKNLSLADLLFADSPANAGSDFRAIAATLFGIKGSTNPQSPMKSVSNAKKPAVGLSEEKPDTPNNKEILDPALLVAPAQLSVPPQTVPMPLIQVSAKQDGSDDNQLNSSASLATTQQAAGPQLKGDQIPPSLLAVPLRDDDIPASASTSTKSGTPLVQPSPIEEAVKPLPANGTVHKKEVEPGKASADRSQAPAVPQSAQPLAPSVATTDRAKQSTDSSFSGGTEKTSVAINSLPPAAPVEQIPEPSPGRVLESVVATKAVPQSGSVNPITVGGSRSASGRNVSNTAARIKGRDIKDSRITPAPSGKPGFIQATQTLGGANTAGGDKDSPGVPLPGHSGGHGKPITLKQSMDAPSSPASLGDADGPDETLPTSASSPVTAKLVQGMSQSEFRVGMQSQEFGNIDIRTSVARHMFSAQISVEHSDVAKSLTAQLPGLYHRLADQQVTVGNIVIQGQSLGTSSGLAQDAQSQTWQPHGQSGASTISTAGSNAEPIPPVMTEGFDSAGRLDIRI